jgi:hypothetical protein
MWLVKLEASLQTLLLPLLAALLLVALSLEQLLLQLAKVKRALANLLRSVAQKHADPSVVKESPISTPGQQENVKIQVQDESE